MTWTAALLGITLLVIGGLAGWAWQQRQAAQSLALAGQALFEVNRSPEQALFFALASLPASQTFTDTLNYDTLVTRAVFRTFNSSLVVKIIADQHRNAVNSVAWSPDGTRFLTGSDDGTVRVWDATTGAELHGFFTARRVPTVGWSADGLLIAACLADSGEIRVWTPKRFNQSPPQTLWAR